MVQSAAAAGYREMVAMTSDDPQVRLMSTADESEFFNQCETQLESEAQYESPQPRTILLRRRLLRYFLLPVVVLGVAMLMVSGASDYLVDSFDTYSNHGAVELFLEGCPKAFPYLSKQAEHHHKICYDQQAYAAGTEGAACGTWCTLDANVGSGCGPNANRLCRAARALGEPGCPAAFPYVSTKAVDEKKICYSKETYAKADAGGPCSSWCTLNVAYGSGCGDNQKKRCPGIIDTAATTAGFNAAEAAQYRADATCPANAGVCFCSNGYKVTGKDQFGVNTIEKGAPSDSACQAWKFKVGDVILVEKPSGLQIKYFEASMVAFATGSNYVHSAVVTRIIGSGTYAEDIIITEALKGVIKRVVQNNMRTLVTRYPFGGLAIRRADPAKFPDFYTKSTQDAITAWGDKVLNQPFDTKMVNPTSKVYGTEGRYVQVNPSCDERQRADKMYQAGGPGQWNCAQLAAWTLAFPGRLNLGSATPKDPEGCPVPPWVIQNVQPSPGTLMREGENKGIGSGSGASGFFERTSWKMPCAEEGCWIGVPM